MPKRSNPFGQDVQPSKKLHSPLTPAGADPRQLLVPLIGPRPIHTFTLQVREREIEVRILIDTGSSIPILSEGFVKKNEIPVRVHTKPIIVRRVDGTRISSAGKYHTPRYRLRYEDHAEVIAFEVFELEEGIDGILPAWWVEKHSPSDYISGEMVFDSDFCHKHCLFYGLLEDWNDEEPEDIVVSAIRAKSVDPIEPFEEMSEEERPALTSKVPAMCHDLLRPFEKEFADRLPEHTEYDHAIDLMPGTTPPSSNIYPMSANELKILDEYLKDMERTGKIRKSTSPAGAPAIFVPKPNSTELRFCVDYRRLNNITIKNRYPLPLMDELRDRLQGAVWKTKLDLKNGYYLVRIKEGDEWKTAFRTRYGHFEYTVMPFGLANAPATFQNMINSILRDLLDPAVIAYLDESLLYPEAASQ